jgi:hypothetical protein
MKDMSELSWERREPVERLMPHARTDQLVVSEVDDEVLVYDLTRHRAHCLNRTTALVWRHCDGQTPVAALAARLQGELGAPIEAEVVWLALRQLDRAHLLRDPLTPPADISLSRQELLRKVGLGGIGLVALPAVASILAPAAAAAASCVPDGLPCRLGGVILACCSGRPCNPHFGRCPGRPPAG